MILVVTLLMLAALLVFVGYPLVWAMPQQADTAPPAVGQREQLLAERENALSTLKELEFEHSIGNLSGQDYDVLRGAQRHKAVAILRELDRADETDAAPTNPYPSALDHLSLDARLEEEIARARARLAKMDGVAPERCPACGAPRERATPFCAECGEAFSGTITCPACQASCPPRAKFCADCGSALDGSNTG